MKGDRTRQFSDEVTDGRLTDPRLRRALDRALALGEVGVQVAAYLNGKLILHDWIGVANKDLGTPVDGATLFPIFSTTKAVAATALHLQAERKLVDYEAPIATYWPEFSAHGKGGVTIRDVLTHRSGIPQVPDGMTLHNMGDWELMVSGIADLVPIAEPGVKSTYSPITFGWILGEVVRRTDSKGRSFGQFIRDEICQPLEVDDLWLGLPDREDYRVAKLVGEFRRPASPLWEAASPSAIAPVPENFNHPYVWHTPRTVITNASALARLFAMLANCGELAGKRLLSEDRVRSFTVPRRNPDEWDDVYGGQTSSGIGGFRVGGVYPPADPVAGTSPSVIAHPGAGGTIAWADIDIGLGAAICHNRMFVSTPPVPLQDHPIADIGQAIREVVAEHLSRRV